MPEGDAVRRTARRLDEALAGQGLVRAELRVPRFATVDLRGMRVLGTEVRGKHMLTRLVDDRRALTLHHHLRMDGLWRTGPVGPLGAPGHQIRVLLASGATQAVGIRVHMVEVLPSQREVQWVGHLGPDILGDSFDAGVVADRVAGTGRPLVESLLDQRVVCGMGTMWAAELAHVAGADPHAPSDAIPDLAMALARIRDRMQWALDAPPLARRRALAVFERVGQPCRRCGTPIRAGRVGVAPEQRPTYWCPGCQPPERNRTAPSRG